MLISGWPRDPSHATSDRASQLFLLEKTLECLPEPAGAAGLRGGGSGSEIRTLRLHQDWRRCRSCVHPNEKSFSRLGRGIRKNRVQSPAPKPQPPIAVCVKAEVPAARPAPPPALRPRLLASSNPSSGLRGHVGAGPEL